MSRGVIATLVLATLVAASCSGDAPPPDPSSAFDGISAADPRDLPLNFASREGTRGPNGGTLFDPISAPIDETVAYRFSLGHCGLQSPVDVDGSFWDAVDGTTPSGDELNLADDSEMINATGGVIVVIGDEMRFRSASGSVVRFVRHDGGKEFPQCE